MRLYYCFVILLLLAGLFFLSGCIKEEEFPPEPYIEFIGLAKIQNANNIDDKGILKISFTDGDGDMGLADNDTMQPFDKSSIYYYNFFIKYFEKQHGQFVEVPPAVTFNSRIPELKSNNINGAIKGEIEIELFINNPFSPYDTVRFEAYIVDRALHHSNTITTNELIVKKH
ncbi:MAG: hypothetical protein PHR81_00740 [Bacteroidales bacterium]|jgi:hypothetical protein|nr:hypothetical protein [Bacteroidales bacterium]MDD4213315.1 hypothetical protein [Bacteroidales bacterium]